AEDRQDRGHADRRREPRQALLPARQGRQEGSRPRAAPELAAAANSLQQAVSRLETAPGSPLSSAPMASRKGTGRKLLAFDRRLGGRYVAGADEAGRGPLAGPLVVAGVLLDVECLREHRARPLGLLNDSKQLDRDTRDGLYRAVLACAERVSVHVFPPGVIDR